MAINTDNLGSPRGTTAGGRVNAARAAQIASVAKHPIGQPMANIMLDRNRESAAHSLGQQNQPYVPANPNEAKAYSVGASKAQGIVAETGVHEAPTGIRPAVQPAAPTGGITAGVAQLPNPQVTASSAPTQMRPAEVTASSAQTQMRPTGVPAVRPAVNPAQSGQYLPATPQPAPAAIPARVPETFTGVQAAQTTQSAGGPTARPPVARPALPAPSPVATAAPVSGITGGAAPAYEPTTYINGQGQPVPRPGRITSPEGQAWNAERNAAAIGGGGAPPTPPTGGGGQPPSMGRKVLNAVKDTSATGGKTGLLKTAGGVAIAAPALATAITAGLDGTNADRTDGYAKRFGVAPPTGDGSVGDVAKYTALQAGGFASDVGSTLTMGAADNFYRDKNPSGNGTGEAAGQIVGGTVGAKVGSSMGGKVGTYAGKAIDKVAQIATRGKYKGNLAERFVGGAGNVVGAGAGITSGLALGDTVGSKVDQHYGNEMRPDQPSATATQPDTADSGQSGGYITDNQGNRQDYNPKTQQFEGADIGKPGRGTLSIMEGAGQQHQERLGRLDAAFAKYQAAGDTEGMRRVADPDNKDHQVAIGAASRAGGGGPRVTVISDTPRQQEGGPGGSNQLLNQAIAAANQIKNPRKRAAALTDIANQSQDGDNNAYRQFSDQQNLALERQRTGVLQEESDRRMQGLDMDLASKKRIAGLFDQYQNAKTLEERNGAESALMAAQGKSAADKYMQVDMPTGETDQYGAPVLQRMIVNPETKEVFDPRGQNASNTSSAPQPPQAGLKYAGKDAKSGQLVWIDAQGNRVIDDGK